MNTLMSLLFCRAINDSGRNNYLFRNVDMADKHDFYKSNKGQVVLSLVFVIGGIVVFVGLTLAFLAASFINSSYGFRESQKAEAVATSGVYDAMLRLSRSKDMSGSYSVPIGILSADVSILQNSPSPGLATITSVSTVSRRERSVSVVVSINSNSGVVSLVSWSPPF